VSDKSAAKSPDPTSDQPESEKESRSTSGGATHDLGKREPIPGPSLKSRIKQLTGELAAEAKRDAEATLTGPAREEKPVKGTESKDQPAKIPPPVDGATRPVKPVTSSDEAKPSTSGDKPKPAASSEEAKPAAKADVAEKPDVAKGKLDAEPLGDDDVKQIDDTTGHGSPSKSKSKDSAPSSNDQLWQIVFQMLENDTRSITVRVDRVTVIGRLDAEDPAAEADLDLGPYGGAELGVSRQHAILMPNIEGLWMVDLDSTNGTWINGLYLQPGMKYRLRNGDVIDFGSLRVLVRVIGAINYTPSQEENVGSATLVSRRKPPRTG